MKGGGGGHLVPSTLYGQPSVKMCVLFLVKFFLKLNFSRKVAPRPPRDRTNKIGERDESRDAGRGARADWPNRTRRSRWDDLVWSFEGRAFSEPLVKNRTPRRDPLNTLHSLQTKKITERTNITQNDPNN